MKKILLTILLAFCCLLAACKNDSVRRMIDSNYYPFSSYFEQSGGQIVAARKNEDQTYTVIVLTSYRIELYKVITIDGEYQITLINYL